MAFTLSRPVQPDPSKPMVDQQGRLTVEWITYFRALDRWLAQLAAST